MVQPPKPPPIILIAPVESIADVEEAPLFANQESNLFRRKLRKPAIHREAFTDIGFREIYLHGQVRPVVGPQCLGNFRMVVVERTADGNAGIEGLAGGGVDVW